MSKISLYVWGMGFGVWGWGLGVWLVGWWVAREINQSRGGNSNACKYEAVLMNTLVVRTTTTTRCTECK